MKVIALAVAVLPTGVAALDSSRPPGTSTMRYESAFSDYRPYSEGSKRAWREANDALAHAGHGAHGAMAPSAEMQGADRQGRVLSGTPSPAQTLPPHTDHSR